MRLTVDRTEGEEVVCEKENGEMICLSLGLFQEIPKDGDILELRDGAVIPDPDATAARRQKMQEKFRNLLKK